MLEVYNIARFTDADPDRLGQVAAAYKSGRFFGYFEPDPDKWGVIREAVLDEAQGFRRIDGQTVEVRFSTAWQEPEGMFEIWRDQCGFDDVTCFYLAEDYSFLGMWTAEDDGTYYDVTCLADFDEVDAPELLEVFDIPEKLRKGALEEYFPEEDEEDRDACCAEEDGDDDDY